MMHWVIQSNIYEEENYENLLVALERLGLSHSIHKVVPFVGTLDPEPVIPPEANAIVLGSYTLARVARDNGWVPGAFLENLDFEVQLKHWGNRMFNADAQIYPFAEIPFQEQPFFMRPVLDTKAFTGLVVDWGYYTTWRDGLLRVPELADPVNYPIGVSLLNATTPTMVCKKKEIYNETRTWVIDGRVVTASGYKIGSHKRYTTPGEVDLRILEFADRCTDIWMPNRAYVFDVFDTPDGLKCGEVNNLNSAGWYRADMNKLIMALESMKYA